MQVPARTKIIKLALDESSLQCFTGKAVGNVFKKVAQHKPKAHRRKNISLILTISDDPDVQQRIPSFIIGNFHTFLKKEMTALSKAVGDRVELIRNCCVGAFLLIAAFCVRQNSAWNNGKLFAYVIERLAKAIAPTSDEQLVLIMDSLPVHIGLPAVRSLVKHRVWPIIVPPHCTSRLQAPDTHVFSPLKSELRDRCDEMRSKLQGGMSMQAYLEAVRMALESVVYARPWEHAFVQNGFALHQEGISERLATVIGDNRISAEMPSEADVALCVPRNHLHSARIISQKFFDAAAPMPVRSISVRSARAFAASDRISELEAQVICLAVGIVLLWKCCSLGARARQQSLFDVAI